MKGKFFTDVASAVGVFRAAREARKDGRSVKIPAVTPLPCYRLPPGFLNTVEGCTLSNCEPEVREAAKGVFEHLPYDHQRALEFLPKDGEFVERAQFWSVSLKTAMTPRQYQIAMIAILRWYQHIKRMRGNAT